MNSNTEGEAEVQKVSICFVAHNAYGALIEQERGHIGGIERQQALMAHWFADQGHNVSVITWDEGQGDSATCDIRVFGFCRKDDGFPVLRFFHPRWTGLNSAMARANADIYYYNCGDLGLGQVALWAKFHKKKVIYSVASEPDCKVELPTLSTFRERILYRYGLLNADRIIVQTRRQQELLLKGFGLSSIRIPMPCSGFSYNGQLNQSSAPRILWVGRFSKEKRLEWLLDLAESLPQYVFDVVGDANANNKAAQLLRRRAIEIPNVVLHGRLVHHQLGELYQRACLLCCTSLFEGFPNTFLEAWSAGVPIVSTFDPDGTIARFELGRTAHTLEDLRKGITILAENKELWMKSSSAAKQYFQTNHTIDSAMPMFLKLFTDLQ